MSLNPKQARFVEEYLVDLNATQAAIRAGYSEKTAASQGERLLRNAEIQAAIKKAITYRSKRTEITQDKVMADIEAIKQDAMQKLPDKDGNFVMANHSAALKACELHGKHIGMFGDKTDAEVKVTIHGGLPSRNEQ